MEKTLPFPVVRTYWIYGADWLTRGGHRHHINRQGLIAMSGTVDIYMNDGISSETIRLDNPGRCLLVEPKDWHTMTFGPKSVLLVVASHPYDRADYIDDAYPIRLPNQDTL